MVLGFVVIATVLVLFQWKVADLRNVVPSFRWTTDSQIASLTPGWIDALDRIANDAEAKRQPNVVGSEQGSQDRCSRARTARPSKLLPARWRRWARGRWRARWRPRFAAHAAAVAENRIFTRDNWSKVFYLGIGFLVVTAIGIGLLGGRVVPFLIGLPAIFGLAWLSRFLAGNGLFVDWGIEYVIFALLLGLLISNTIGVPEWLKPAVQTELFIKTGLVILGASLLFMEVLQAGALGIAQAVLVVFVVWYACFWLCRKLQRRRRIRRHAVDRSVDLRRLRRHRRLRRDQGRQEEALLRHLTGADRRGPHDDRHAVDRQVDRDG